MDGMQCLRETEAAKLLGVVPATLRQWRWRGGGPRFRKLGPGPKAAVRYTVGDLESYIADSARSSTSDPAAT